MRMKRCLVPLCGWLTSLILLTPAFLTADELDVDKAASNRAAFTAKFMGETFQGVTGKIDGYVFWKSADPDRGAFEGSDVYFEVDLNALDTGIDMRNHHMKENYLHTEKYPFAGYKGKIVKAAKQGDREFLVDVEGVMTIHGATKLLSATGRVTTNGNRYRLTCTFPLDLRDYGIEIPSLMGMKVGELLNMDLDIQLVKTK
jgi:polyisoprenoid-binding protein YceI